ncbi:Hypothetical predicted protein [Pelobates cultripes]|nr:Hypothetical predicted protein [Pelobates cultripes]
MKHTCIILAVCLCMAPMLLGEDILCFHHSGNCYMIQTKKLIFMDANTECGPRGSLATMKDEQELFEILQLASAFENKPDIDAFWIGLIRQNKECVVPSKKTQGYSWVSGGNDSKVEYWGEYPKPSCMRRRCVGLQKWNGPVKSREGHHLWAWKDSKCNSNFSSICRSHYSWNFSMIHSFKDQNIPDFLPEMSKITILCKEFDTNITLTCKVENGFYSCLNIQCSCSALGCTESKSCLQHCLIPSNFSCNCSDAFSLCNQTGANCTVSTSGSSTPQTYTDVYNISVSPSRQSDDEEESWFDTLLIPLILGLVALGILLMLVWGGAQMCVRKKKPPRKKSIVPVETQGSDTDSTDHSSSDEEEPQDKIDVP